jgi:transmembrane sensor
MVIEDSKRKLNAQILDEAAEWLVEFNSGEAEPAARPKFDAWLRTSPEHVRAYLELLPIWEEGADLPLDVDADAEHFIAIAKTADNIVPLGVSAKAVSTPSKPGPITARSLERRAAIAASLVLMAAALGTLTWFHLPPDSTYSTQVGEQRSISLSDGSMIELNARSQVRIRFSKEQRSVDLIEGQALFNIAKDRTRPFVVTSEGTQVRAVGTEFDVYQKHGGTIVTVVEGRVAIVRDGLAASENSEGLARSPASPHLPAMDTSSSLFSGIVYLSAGEQLTVTPKVEKKTAHPNVIAATAWTQHRLVFDAATLGDVVEEFNRYNTRPLVLHDLALQNFPISAVFSSTDPASLVRFLQAQPGIRVTTNSAEIEIAARR